MVLDQFGILQKCKTKSGGNEWFSTAWNNGVSRDLGGPGDPEFDPYDSVFKVTIGSPDVPVNIDGAGSAKLRSTLGPISSIRLWVNKTWLNTEMTIYLKRVAICTNIGLRSRSKHTQSGTPNCLWGDYMVNWNIDDEYVVPQVEVTHPVYDRGLPRTDFPNKILPLDRYIGFKTITRTALNNKVLVKGYSNYTATQNLSVGGQAHSDWVKDAEFIFDGTNSTADNIDDPTIFDFCGTSGDNLLGDLTANTLWLNSGTSCWFRINGATELNLRWASVREINPIS